MIKMIITGEMTPEGANKAKLLQATALMIFALSVMIFAVSALIMALR